MAETMRAVAASVFLAGAAALFVCCGSMAATEEMPICGAASASIMPAAMGSWMSGPSRPNGGPPLACVGIAMLAALALSTLAPPSRRGRLAAGRN